MSYLFVFLNRIVFSIYISPQAKIGSSPTFCYQGLGIVIGGEVEIGDNVEIGQGVTLGGRFSKPRLIDGNESHWPVIGNNVFIGPNSVVIGPVTVGDVVIIGANSTILHDCDSHSIYVGSPARKIRRITKRVVGDQYE